MKNLTVTQWPAFETLGEITLVLFFAFGGGEAALGNSGEFRNPSRTIPKGILLGYLGILIAYLAIQLVAQGVLGDALGTFTDAPLAETGRALLGTFGYNLLMIGAILSIYSLLSGDVLSTSRLLYAGSRDGLYPSVFGKLNVKHLSPANAILCYAVVIGILSSLGNFKTLALVSSSALLLIYAGVIVATLKRKRQKLPEDKDTFHAPGGLVIPVLALCVVGWFLFHVPMREFMAMAGFFGVFTVFYFVYVRPRISRLQSAPTDDENDEPPAHV